MNKIILKIGFTIILIFSICMTVKATYNGTGSQAVAGGGNLPSNIRCGTPFQYHSNDELRSAAYVARVIHSNGKDANWKLIGKPLVMVYGNGVGTYNHASIYRSYANNIGAGIVFGQDNALINSLVTQIYNTQSNNTSSLSIAEYLDKNNRSEQILKLMNADSPSNYTLSHVPAKRDGSSYGKAGYRLVIEKIIITYQKPCSGGGTGLYAGTRKSIANETGPEGTGDSYGFWKVAPAPSYKNSFFGEIRTEFNDINVQASSYSYENFKSYNRGAGLHIYDLKIFKRNFDYSIDAACENCDENNTNGSYLIQDTPDWEAVLATADDSMPNKNAAKYYKKKVGGCEVLCREEYKIVFPNANDKISVESGRFFTVNKLGGSMYTTGVPNFKQIKITKVRECRTTSGNQRACLASFANAAKSSTNKADKTGTSAGDVGTIKVTYKENYKDSKYNEEEYKNIELKENKDRTIAKEEYINSTVEKSNVMLKSTVTKYFELPENVFRYINIRDGVSSFEKPTEGLEHYLDVETANFPVSINNKTKDKNQTAGTVTINYSLPSNTDDPYTLIKKAFNSKNDYFQNPDAQSDENIYAKTKKGTLDDTEKQLIQQSSCAKLYGYGTSKFNSCVNARTTNKAGNCYNQIVKENKYVCDIGLCPEEGCLSCRIEGNTFYGKNGEEVSERDYAKQCGCRVIDGKYYGQRGNEITKEEYLVECPQICKVENGKYYGKKGQLVSRKQYEEECPDKCLLCNGGKCCPDLDMVCPDMNGECPGRGRIIIYRPIDLENPFPGQTNYDRATGNNWCAYNVKTGKMNCKSTNGVATTHIQKNRSTDNESVYDLTPLYEVNLDPTIMKSIRKYNKTHEYDDFTLDCTNGKTCYSTFLRESGNGLKVTGVCANKADALACAESRG